MWVVRAVQQVVIHSHEAGVLFVRLRQLLLQSHGMCCGLHASIKQ